MSRYDAQIAYGVVAATHGEVLDPLLDAIGRLDGSDAKEPTRAALTASLRAAGDSIRAAYDCQQGGDYEAMRGHLRAARQVAGEVVGL